MQAGDDSGLVIYPGCRSTSFWEDMLRSRLCRIGQMPLCAWPILIGIVSAWGPRLHAGGAIVTRVAAQLQC